MARSIDCFLSWLIDELFGRPTCFYRNKVENCGPLIQGWALKKKPATLVDMNCGVCDSYELSSCLVFIIYFGFFFLEGAIIDWPIINCFWNMGALPNRSNSLDPSGKIEIAVHPYGPTFSVYLHENWTLGNPYGKNLRCYWELLMRELLGNLRNHMRTWWERNGNKKKKQKCVGGGGACVCLLGVRRFTQKGKGKIPRKR